MKFGQIHDTIEIYYSQSNKLFSLIKKNKLLQKIRFKNITVEVLFYNYTILIRYSVSIIHLADLVLTNTTSDN